MQISFSYFNDCVNDNKLHFFKDIKVKISLFKKNNNNLVAMLDTYDFII